MKKQFKDLLHRYKVEAFKISHNNDHAAEPTEEILRFTEEALNNAYQYHFRRNPSPERLETFRLIKNYTLEALMPPVIEKMMRRVVALERQQHEMVRLVDDLLEVLSEEGVARDGTAG